MIDCRLVGFKVVTRESNALAIPTDLGLKALAYSAPDQHHTEYLSYDPTTF
jgi:hypothetical protein